MSMKDIHKLPISCLSIALQSKDKTFALLTTTIPMKITITWSVRPIILAIPNECVKVESEEYQGVDEQVIPWTG